MNDETESKDQRSAVIVLGGRLKSKQEPTTTAKDKSHLHKLLLFPHEHQWFIVEWLVNRSLLVGRHWHPISIVISSLTTFRETKRQLVEDGLAFAVICSSLARG